MEQHARRQLGFNCYVVGWSDGCHLVACLKACCSENLIAMNDEATTESVKMPQTLSLQRAAAFLFMSPSTLRKRAAAGRVPGYKPGKAWVFLLDDLVNYLKASRPCPSISAQNLRTTGSAFSSTDAKSGSALAQRIAARRRNLKQTREAARGDKLN